MLSKDEAFAIERESCTFCGERWKCAPSCLMERKNVDPRQDPERRREKETTAEQMKRLAEWAQQQTKQKPEKPVMQQFDSGATRSADEHKPDFEGFFSPLVMDDYAEFMQKARLQDDGKFRASDNWQRGMPFYKYMKSMFRHFMQLWKLHRGYPVEPEMRAGQQVAVTVRSAIHGIMFNSMGYLHEFLLNERAWETRVISEREDGSTVTAQTTRRVM